MSDAWTTPCATCGACCRAYLVDLCGYDVWRLCTAQRLNPTDFLVPHPTANTSGAGFYLDHDGPPFGLALDKKGRFARDHPCVFLLELGGGHQRCGVYADRPLVCRAYPMAMWSGVVHLRADALCPPGSWPLAVVERPEWRAHLQRLRLHHDLYAEVVARWNERVRAAGKGSRCDLGEYYAYLLTVYDELAVLTDSWGPDAMARVETTWPNVPRHREDFPTPDSELPPWLAYALAAREVIDRRYPSLPPLPLFSSMWETPSELPPALKRT